MGNSQASSSSQRVEEMLSTLKEEGYRLTPQRMAVVRILAGDNTHPTVEQVYDRVRLDFPMTSLGTVYKIVTLLKDTGQVMELGFGDERNHYDGRNPSPHPHLMCLKCKKIVDPDVEVLADLSMELTQKTGYRILNHRVDFFGICPECQQQE